MQRVKGLMYLQRQVALFLNSADKPLLTVARTSSSIPHAVSACLEERQAEPCSIFLCHTHGVIPISEDAERIYADNRATTEERVKQQLLPFSVRRKTKTKITASNLLGEESQFVSKDNVWLSTKDQTATDSPMCLMSPSGDDASSRLLCSTERGGSGSPSPSRGNLPSSEQLEEMKSTISSLMPGFFKAQPHRYNLYTQDVIFENNYWGQCQVHKGINSYAWELLKLKTKCNLAYCSITFYLINVGSNEEDGTIRVRWTMKCIPQLQGFMFWRWNLFNVKGQGGLKDKMRETFKVHDGVNTFWLNKDGAIYKHRLDKVLPNEEVKTSTATAKITKLLNNKLAGAANSSSSPSHVKYDST